MPFVASMPTLRFTSVEVLQGYLSVNANSADKLETLGRMLASAERFAENYSRRHFAADPPLADSTTGYQRRVLGVSGGLGQSKATGSIAIGFGGNARTLTLPATSADVQLAMGQLLGNPTRVTCSGGPLPTYPVAITFAGDATGTQGVITTDSSALGGGYASVVDCGFDSAPPILKRFTSRGKSTLRVPDLRTVDSGADPRNPQFMGVNFYGQRLLPDQYFTGSNSYAAGGADEFYGDSYAEPATHITVGYGAAMSVSAATAFGVMSPVAFANNDLAIVGRWGFGVVPEDVQDVIYRIGARSYREREAAFSDQLATDQAIYSFFKTMPPYVQAALDQYKVPNIGLI